MSGSFLVSSFSFTPIVYPITILPESVRDLMSYNPMANLINAFQGILVAGQWPDWSSLLPVSIIAIILCAFGMRFFLKHVGEMVNEL
jgi:lipopolysaccharide transport system permease protein